LIEPGRILVGFHAHAPNHERHDLHRQVGASFISEIPELHIHIVKVPVGSEKQRMQSYRASPHVRYAEPDYHDFPKFIPNDPYYTTPIETSVGEQSQWGLRRTNPELAWDIVRNTSPQTVIAIIDTGIDPNHPDLAAKIYKPINVGPGEPDDYIDRNGHGTHVAGIAAAITNNNIGVAGMSFNTALIMPIRAGDGSVLVSATIQGIVYAVQNGADVINMSFGGPFYSNSRQLAIDYAWANGLVLVGSAGNEGYEQPQYPSGCNFVISVSATGKDDLLAPFSNWGVGIGVAAPGVDILSTTPTYPVGNGTFEDYDAFSGTSMSAPFISGLAALLKAIHLSWTNQQIVSQIEASANPIAETFKAWSPLYGYGLVDAGESVTITSSYGRASVRSNRTHLLIMGATAVRQKHSKIKKASMRRSRRNVAGKPLGISLNELRSLIQSKPSVRRRKKGEGKPIFSSFRRTNLTASATSNSDPALGSLYGQLLSSDGIPIGGATVYAFTAEGILVGEYLTKRVIPYILDDDYVFYSDGMFRLKNLPAGNYVIIATLEEEVIYRKQSAVSAGTDTFLQLVAASA
jgi:thermitase